MSTPIDRAYVVTLSPECQCSPLWSSDRENLAPESLALHAETVRALWHWAADFDRWYRLEEPSSPGPEPSTAEVAAFEAEGVRLWKQLRAELAPDTHVHYRSTATGRVLTDPAELS